MSDPAPKNTQVSDFVKNWRQKNPNDSMAPLIDLCDGRRYDQINIEILSDTSMMFSAISSRIPTPAKQGRFHILGMARKPIHYA
ncbi:uncharacterized protein PITG_18982 [Phytophthora infestans T30-4]|uniref:Uncharacterized protein n=1 Tax=Phytophthora infestans (strain T30-4) TaxID=403677 RepID=D0NZ88_PHYIT|nr:uncharacterized protein PITG_18982 [Phytophthora infestans T30-4]EEY68882.1 hypothetical protein PITG_18982 [Phytophthora infestans T30-4]|eukprot:XP_002997341.1 hypothetical protein PITG_18982 [Phytophthora infestans T30-4]